MQYLTNRILTKYFLFLALIFTLCVSFIVGTHIYIKNSNIANEKEEDKINAQIAKIRLIDADIYALHSFFIQLQLLLQIILKD